MKVISYPLGQLQANCYFLIKKEECLLIDPGDDADFILGKIQQADLHLVGVMATHGHFDHVMAVGEIQESFDVPLYISKKDTFLLRRTKKSSEFFLGFSVPVLPIKKIKNLNIENWKLKIIETPGHTPGSVCYYFPEEKVIFTGDTLFKDGIGRYDFSYSSKNDLVNSLKKILKLPEETIVYPGNGAKTTILEEKDILTTIY